MTDADTTATAPDPADGFDADATSPPDVPVGETGADDGPSVSSRLFETEGGKPLPDIEAEYDVSKPVALIVRGLMKLARKSGFPAIADMFAGVALLILRWRGNPDRSGSADDGGEGPTLEDAGDAVVHTDEQPEVSGAPDAG